MKSALVDFSRQGMCCFAAYPGKQIHLATGFSKCHEYCKIGFEKMVIAPWKYLGNADKYVNDDLSKQNALLTYVGTGFSFLDMCY